MIRNALFFGRDKFSNFLILWATYTDPEVAHVGLYEKDLQAQNIEYATFTSDPDCQKYLLSADGTAALGRKISLYETFPALSHQ